MNEKRPPLSAEPKPRPYLIGLDGLRVLACLAVIAMHAPFSTVKTGVATSSSVITVLEHLRFCVPFFFAAALLLTTAPADQIGESLRKRSYRLLLPFLVWSLVYIGLNAAKNSLGSGTLDWPKLEQFTAWILGGAAVHLYYLPMLFVGTVLALVLEPALKKLPAVGWCFTILATVGLSYWQRASGNDFRIGDSTAFVHTLGLFQPSWLRLAAVVAAWAVALLPYVVIASALRKFAWTRINELGTRRHWLSGAAAGLFAVHIVAGPEVLGAVVGGLLSGFIGVIAASLASGWIGQHASLRRLGAWSFGIYLVHVIPLQCIQLLLIKLGGWGPGTVMSLPSSAAIVLTVFTLSALCCAAVEAYAPPVVKSIFGLR